VSELACILAVMVNPPARPSRPLLRPRVQEILAIIEEVCVDHLDDEYAVLCAQLLSKLVHERPSPLTRGDPRIWAGGMIYTIATINFLFEPHQTPHITAHDLGEFMGLQANSMAAKSRQIRKLLALDLLDPELCRRELLDDHPTAWLVELDGIILDARTLPLALQNEARGRGLIPAITI
jgi:hypothetical protein